MDEHEHHRQIPVGQLQPLPIRGALKVFHHRWSLYLVIFRSDNGFKTHQQHHP